MTYKRDYDDAIAEHLGQRLLLSQRGGFTPESPTVPALPTPAECIAEFAAFLDRHMEQGVFGLQERFPNQAIQLRKDQIKRLQDEIRDLAKPQAKP